MGVASPGVHTDTTCSQTYLSFLSMAHHTTRPAHSTRVMKNLGSGWYLSIHSLFSGILGVEHQSRDMDGGTPIPQAYLQVQVSGKRATKGDRQWYRLSAAPTQNSPITM